MSKTSSREELLQVCIQDLRAGRVLAARRLSAVAAAAGPALAPVVQDLRRDLDVEAKQLEQSGKKLEGPENLWMAGIIDDAQRDTRSIEHGALLDTAIVGALRKAVVADEVSLETAVVLARALGEDELAHCLQAMRDRCRRTDGTLRAHLEATGGS